MRPALAPVVLLALASVALAGCADGDGPESPQDGGYVPPTPPPAEGKGGIRGVVLDTSITPVVGAVVRIDSLDLETTTDENGGFVFLDLEPGTYFLVVSAPGFATVQASATVVADEVAPPVTKVQLERDAATAPFVQALQFEGHMVCNVSFFAGAFPLCQRTQDVTGADVNSVVFPVDGYPDWIQGELTWESTQSAGDALSFSVWDGGDFDPVRIVGASPLTLQLDQETLIYGNETETGESPMYTPGKEFSWRVFTDGIEGTNSGICPDDIPGVVSFSCLAGAGAAIDQSFTIYTNVFYNVVPPEDYRFLEDGAYAVDG